MQHELNRKYLKTYAFYNPEMDAPDFMRVAGSEIPETVVFDVVGSRGAIGEKARAQRVGEVTAFLLSNPKTQHLPKVEELAKQAYQDAGVKNPEKYLNVQEQNPEIQAAIQQIQQQAQEAAQQMEIKVFELEKQLAITKTVNDAKMGESQNLTSLKMELGQINKAIEELKLAQEHIKLQRESEKNERPQGA